MGDRRRILILCCGAGGCAMGYWIAGWEPVGVDIVPQPHFPFEFHRVDAMTFPLDGFDAVHAGPPCQAYGRLRHREDASMYPKLIKPLRERFAAEIPRVPYVIENVEDALPEMVEPARFCGSSFGIRVRRHRLMETNWPLAAPSCDHAWQDGHKPYRLYVGKSRTNGLGYRHSGIQQVFGGNHNVGGRSLFMKSVAMGIDWMTEDEINESIPPAYTVYIGRRLLAHIESAEGGLRCPTAWTTS